MIKLEAIVEPASAILIVFMYAIRTKRPDTSQPLISLQMQLFLIMNVTSVAMQGWRLDCVGG